MKIKLVLLCLLISVTGITQTKKVNIKLAPLSLIDFINFPTIQGGIEIAVSKNISSYTELGVRYTKGFNENPDTSFISSKGLKLKTEFRYYLDRSLVPGNLNGNYIGVNAFFIRDHHNTGVHYYSKEDSTFDKLDNFAVKKNIWGANLLVGKQESFGKHFLIDIYAGLGLRFRKIITTNKEFNPKEDKLFKRIDPSIPEIKYKAESFGGENVLMNLTAGFRVCYVL